MNGNLVLEHLRAIRGDMAEMKLDIRDAKHRMTALEIAMAALVATEGSHYASLATRVERTGDRLDRIERRLELAPA
jgi:hypothetical protein